MLNKEGQFVVNLTITQPKIPVTDLNSTDVRQGEAVSGQPYS